MLDWNKYITVANRYQHKARAEDREDLSHNIIVALADAQTVKDNNGGGELSLVAMYRIASIEVTHYWRGQYKITNGLDCGSCSKAQRRKCRRNWSYAECPKAIKLESLSKPITDSEGNLTELGELIADDKAIDLEAWLDDKTFLLGCPVRLIEIAKKRQDGNSLTHAERDYLWRYRKKEQKSLIFTGQNSP
jgi:hypothetical protein